MIKDVMVWLDGGVSDEVRLAAVADIARRLQPKVIIGLFLNPLPLPGPVEGDATTELIEHAREAGDEIEKARRVQLTQHQFLYEPESVRLAPMIVDPRQIRYPRNRKPRHFRESAMQYVKVATAPNPCGQTAPRLAMTLCFCWIAEAEWRRG